MYNISIISDKDLGKVVEVIGLENKLELAAAMESENWAPATFRDGRRNKETFISTQLLVLDVDEGCTSNDVDNVFRGYSYIYGESRNHQKEKHGIKADRFRVVLFLSKPIDSEAEFKATFTDAQKRWPFIDKACSDVSRFFYPCNFMSTRVVEGMEFQVQTPSILDTPVNIDLNTVHEGKGELWKSTLKLLQFGAKPGHRHAALINAVGNLREQNYTIDETTAMLSEMAHRTYPDGWAHQGLSNDDTKKIADMYSRDPKYDFKKEDEPQDFLTALDLIDETFAYLADKDKVKGEPTGIDSLDRLLGGGFRTGELTVLMAQAKTGKNAFCHYLLHKSLKKNVAWGYASRELTPATEVIPNLLTIETGTNWWNEAITERVKDTLKTLSKNWPLYFAPGYGHFDYSELEKWVKLLKTFGVNMFLFDHFHYALSKEDYESTSSLIKQLKTLTKELDIHMLMIVQPRSLRDGEKLSMATLRGGAAIGQALDNLLIMERVKTTGQPNVSKIALSEARHRLAKPGDIYLQYDPVSTTFSEVAEERVKFNVSKNEMPPAGYFKGQGRFKSPKVIEQ